MPDHAPGADANARDRERDEHALRSRVLARVVLGAAHDIRNVLNAMGIRLQLIEQSDGEGDGARGAAYVREQSGKVREQVERIREMLRRLGDATEPLAPLGVVDLRALVGDVAGLLGCEAKMRRVQLALDLPASAVRTPADPARVGRLVLCLLGQALAATPEGGRLAARAALRDGAAVLEVDRTPGDPDGDLGYDLGVLAAAAGALGGRLERGEGEQGSERLTLTVPGDERR